jgi:hypothetical protein
VQLVLVLKVRTSTVTATVTEFLVFSGWVGLGHGFFFGWCNWTLKDCLAKYLDCYSMGGIDFFIWHMRPMNFPHLQTFRSICQTKLGPNHQQELASRTSFIVTT